MRKLHRLEGEAFKKGGQVQSHGHEAHEYHETHNPKDKSFAIRESKNKANGIAHKFNTPPEKLAKGKPDAVRVGRGKTQCYRAGGYARRYDDGGDVSEGAPASTGTFDTPTGSKLADTGNKILGGAANLMYKIPGIGDALKFVGDNAENVVDKVFGIKSQLAPSIQLKNSNPEKYWAQDEYLHSQSPNTRISSEFARHYGNGSGYRNAFKNAIDMGEPGSNWKLKATATPEDRALFEQGMNEQTLKRGGSVQSASGGKWIQKAIKNPGALHQELGIAPGKKIPMRMIKKAEHSSNPLLAKRAHLADTLKHMNRPRNR